MKLDVRNRASEKTRHDLWSLPLPARASQRSVEGLVRALEFETIGLGVSSRECLCHGGSPERYVESPCKRAA